jgi:hypothetical protein
MLYFRGEITVQRSPSLDREAIDNYKLTIQAKDQTATGVRMK